MKFPEIHEGSGFSTVKAEIEIIPHLQIGWARKYDQKEEDPQCQALS